MAQTDKQYLLELLSGINPSGDSINCLWCAQAVDRSLALGKAFPAAPSSKYLPRELLELDYGQTFVEADSWQRIADVLYKAGHLARAIIDVATEDGSIGHLFNAVNLNGTIYFIDGQNGRIYPTLDIFIERGLVVFSYLQTR